MSRVRSWPRYRRYRLEVPLIHQQPPTHNEGPNLSNIPAAGEGRRQAGNKRRTQQNANKGMEGWKDGGRNGGRVFMHNRAQTLSLSYLLEFQLPLRFLCLSPSVEESVEAGKEVATNVWRVFWSIFVVSVPGPPHPLPQPPITETP